MRFSSGYFGNAIIVNCKNCYGLCISISLIILLAVTISYLSIISPLVLKKSKNYKNINYNSSMIGTELSKIKECSEIDFPFKEVDISFKMKINSIYNWNNIFQTAHSNRGVRLELVAPASLVLVIGSLKGFVGLEITSSLNMGEWYFVRIKIDKDKHIKVFFNNVLVVDETNKGINYSISDIAIGTGYSKLRPFDGEIKDFSLFYNLYDEKEIIKLIKFFSTILFLVATSLFIKVFLLSTYR